MDKQLQYYKCFITPGHIAVSRDPTFLYSVCGSGVVVTLWDKVNRCGGMAHCIFARLGRGQRPSNYYADIAVSSLVRQLQSSQARTWSLQAQIFGGANFGGQAKKQAEQIVRVIKKAFKKLDVEIASEDTGGIMGRKVVLDTFLGEAAVFKTKRIRMADWAPEIHYRGARRN